MGTNKPVRIRLRYVDLDSFVEKFSPNVTRGGVFLATKNYQPVGSTIDFEIQLAGGQVALSGQGNVTWVREWSADEPNRPYGLGVQFIAINASTRQTLALMLKRKETTTAAVPGVRRQTAVLTPLGEAKANGVQPAPVVDTSVDLASEFGIDPASLRLIVDRSWHVGAAKVDDDLADLLRPEPVQPVSLAQALSDLPRLLDLSSGRRRSSTMKTVDQKAAAVSEANANDQSGPIVAVTSVSATTVAPASATIEATAPDNDITDMNGQRATDDSEVDDARSVT